MATSNDQSNPKSAECSICFNLLQKPKLLSCHHTFCEGCLVTLYRSQGEQREVSCPLCRETTHVPDGNISSLGTNHALQSLVEELASRVPCCTVCKSSETPVGEAYCSDCDMYMCESCYQTHNKWAVFFQHTVVPVAEVAAGKVTIKRKAKCRKHNDKDGDFFCEDCKKYACVVCRVHEHLGHNIVEDEEREQRRREKLKLLVEQLELRKGCVTKFVNFIEEEQKKTKSEIQKIRQQIESIRDAAIKRIQENSDSLISKCEELEKGILDKQGDTKRESSSYVSSIESAGELVTKGATSRLDGDALVAHDTLCQELEKLLEDFKTDYPSVRNLTRCAVGKQFKPINVEEIPALGAFEQKNGWVLGEETEFGKRNFMNYIAPTPCGNMAVGSGEIMGIEIFTPNGQLQERVLQKVKINAIVFLSDGRCVVRDVYNDITLYTPEWEKLDVLFETLGVEGGWGGLDVDSDDYIYVSYNETKNIQVFTPAGGKAERVIVCDGYEPRQIFVASLNKRIVVKYSNSVRIVDEYGTVQQNIIKSNAYPYPTSYHDGSVIIAWVNHEDGLVTFEQYSSELDHVQTLITDVKIQKPKKRNWYYLREFLTGELAFCTPDKLYIFHKSVPLSDV